jgi:uncharacterized protein YuzE
MGIELTYDEDANAAYLELALKDDTARLRQVWASPEGLSFDLVLDVDPDGRMLGIEIIGARGALSPEILETAVPPAS